MDIDVSKVQNILEWVKRQIFLEGNVNSAHSRIVKRGQVYKCDLGVGVGSEIQKNGRPCVVVQHNKINKYSGIVVISPVTHTNKNLDCFVHITDKKDSVGNTILDGYVNVSAIRSIDKARIGDYICDLDSSEMDEIDNALAKSLDLFKHYQKLKNKYNDKIEYIKKLLFLLDDIKKITGSTDNKKIAEDLKKMLDNKSDS